MPTDDTLDPVARLARARWCREWDNLYEQSRAYEIDELRRALDDAGLRLLPAEAQREADMAVNAAQNAHRAVVRREK